MARITFVRHGESEANRQGIWQGQGDAPLSEEGRRQAELVGERLGNRQFDVVVVSDLARARATAGAIVADAVVDPVWREMDIGQWEGRTFEAVAEEHPDLLSAIRRGEGIAFGESGETIGEFESRVDDALRDLTGRLGDGHALVVTHGGLIDAVIGRIIGRRDGRRTFPVVSNTAVTTIASSPSRPDRFRLERFNDSSHLGGEHGFLARVRADEVPVIGFVRHGVTAANKEGRIQGRSCWGLDEEGHRQAKELATVYRAEVVVSSPTRRALETAAAFDRDIAHEPDLVEMAFGAWEGRTQAEILASGDPDAHAVWVERRDITRGGHGETFSQVVERTGRFMDSVSVSGDARMVAVSHGGTIQAVVAAIQGAGIDMVDRLRSVSNASVTHVALTSDGPMLADYATLPQGDVA